MGNSTSRRTRTHYLFTSGTSITSGVFAGTNITTSNFGALYATTGNTIFQDITVGNSININGRLSFNKNIQNGFNNAEILNGYINTDVIPYNSGIHINSYGGGIFATGNGSKVPLMWTSTGNVSINTTTQPQASLDVNGPIVNIKSLTFENEYDWDYPGNSGLYFSSSGSTQLVLYNHSDGLRNRVCGINVSDDTATWGRSTMYMAGRDHIFYIGSTTGSSVAARGTEVMRIKSSGVGIGTSNPQYRLHAVHNNTATPSLISHTKNNQNHILNIKDDGYGGTLSVNPGAGALTSIYGYNTMMFDIRDNTGIGTGPLLILTTGSLFTSCKSYKQFPNDVFILSSQHNNNTGHLGFGCSSTATNNWFIRNNNSLMSINNGNIQSPSTPILQMYRNTTGNLTGVSIGNFTTSISAGNVSSWTSGSCKAMYFKSLSGSFNVSSTGVYNITTGARGYAGTLSCYFSQIGNGIWSSMADVIMPNSTTLRGNVSNVSNYTYNGNQIVATLQPFSGTNTNETVSDSPANSFQVNVTSLGAATTFYWTLTMYAELI